MNGNNFLKRFFKKENPEEINWADFVAFKNQNLEENQNLEYKAGGLIKSPNCYQELAKVITGFANAEGGLLVFGLKEHGQRDKRTKQILHIRPGAVDALPITVTKEIIENKLLSLIQHSIEGITIRPIRKTIRSKSTIYLIDVPQSNRAPHRVEEKHYYQRYNFSTLEMKHYQIADLFGKRVMPDLGIELQKTKTANDDRNHFGIKILIHNYGRAVAKYTTGLCAVSQGKYKMFQSKGWDVREDKKVAQYSTGINLVIYPDIPTDSGFVEFEQESPDVKDDLLLDIDLMSENMPKKTFKFNIPFSELGIKIQEVLEQPQITNPS